MDSPGLMKSRRTAMRVICRWIETGMEESSEEMARIAVRLLFIKPGESIKL